MSDQFERRQSLSHLLAEIPAKDAKLHEDAEAYYREKVEADDVRSSVRQANARFGTDFATAVLYSHFALKLNGSLDRIWSPTSCSENDLAESPTIAIAPGAFHREHPEAGGDGKAVLDAARQYGWRTEILPTESLGTLCVNAAIVVDWLESRSERFILISLSKGTSDVMAALTTRPDLAGKIAGWVSVSGIVAGTPMSNWLLERKRLRPILWFMRWKHKADMQAVRDLRSGKGERLPSLARELAGSVVAQIPRFHIVGFPLKRHLSCFRAKLWHRRFRRYGPNDSVVILEDLIDAPGAVVPVWGADHYLRTSWNAAKALRDILQTIRDESRSRIAPTN